MFRLAILVVNNLDWHAPSRTVVDWVEGGVRLGSMRSKLKPRLLVFTYFENPGCCQSYLVDGQSGVVDRSFVQHSDNF